MEKFNWCNPCKSTITRRVWNDIKGGFLKRRRKASKLLWRYLGSPDRIPWFINNGILSGHPEFRCTQELERGFRPISRLQCVKLHTVIDFNESRVLQWWFFVSSEFHALEFAFMYFLEMVSYFIYVEIRWTLRIYNTRKVVRKQFSEACWPCLSSAHERNAWVNDRITHECIFLSGSLPVF